MALPKKWRRITLCRRLTVEISKQFPYFRRNARFFISYPPGHG